MQISALDAAEPFVTRDGSIIRELLGPATIPAKHQSLAEATLAPGQSTERHYHRLAEEIYFITAGEGRMELDGEVATVRPGDAILIPPGAWHRITALGGAGLRLLCCCAPAYSHGDTYLR